MNRRQFLRNAVGAGVSGLGFAGMTHEILTLGDFTANKEVEKAVAETNSNIKIFNQIAEEWRPISELTVTRYPADRDSDNASLGGAKAQYKNFQVIRNVLNTVYSYIHHFEQSEKEFAGALVAKDKSKTLEISARMRGYVDGLQELATAASQIPGINDYIAEHLEGQRSA